MDFTQSKKIQKLPLNRFQQVDQKVEALRRAGIQDIINLGKGNPDGTTPDFIIAALKQAVALPENHGYTPFDGKPSTLQGVADFYLKQYGVKLDPEKEILVFNGAVVGLVGVIQTMLNPGELFVTPEPFYPTYKVAAELTGADFQTIPTKAENHFLPELSQLLDDRFATLKMLLLNYPNNPTGTVATREFFQEAVQIATKKQVALVHDFAYAAIGYTERPLSILEISGAKEVAVEIYTASKTYNMAGWRFGFAVGNESIIAALKLYHAQFFSIVFGAVQDAAVSALASDQASVTLQKNIYLKRRNLFTTSMQKIGWDITPPEGALFCWVKVPPTYTSQSFADFLLAEAHIVAIPGSYFGAAGEGYIRFSLLESEEKIAEAVARIAKLAIKNV